MLSLTLLPGALALFAPGKFFPWRLTLGFTHIEQIGTTPGIILLMGAALTGGVLEVYLLASSLGAVLAHCLIASRQTRCKTLRADNLDLYERGVQSSYKYVTFYANFAWATGILIISRLHKGDKPCSAILWLLVIARLSFFYEDRMCSGRIL